MQTQTLVNRPTHVNQHQTTRSALSLFWRLLTLLILFAFLGGALFAGFLFYQTVRSYVVSMPVSAGRDLPVLSRFQPAPEAPASVSAADPQTKVSFERQDRINFLLMGVDLRPGERGPARTDTMIIVTLDPGSKTVGMLSIPRDLWVPIPGYGENRINTAYFMGDARDYPGGGPALAKKTIQYNFGIPIHYYIAINFVGFRKLVDEIGGITIDVPKEINDPSFPDDTYGYRTLFIPKGLQHMDGQMALDYARTRHGDSDFNRMRRQQQVIKAVKDQALTLNILPKIPTLWATKEDMVRTDLTLDKIIPLLQIAKDIKQENVKSVVVDESMALGITTPGGAMVLWPDRDRIRQVVAEMFKTPDAVPVQVQSQPSEQIKKLATEGARIEISNGTPSEGLAVHVSEWLKSQGFNVVLVDNAERTDYAQTIVIESNERPYTKGLLLNIFHVTQPVRKNPNAKSDVDMRIIIGKDFDEKEIPDSR